MVHSRILKIYRAFHRFPLDCPIQIKRLGSTKLYQAKLLNFSQGGFYLETQALFEPGVYILLNFIDPLPDQLKFEPYMINYGQVVWNKEVSSKREEGFYFGLGSRWKYFICEWCNTIIPEEDLSLSPGTEILCSFCRNRIATLPGKRIKHCLNRSLFGNVI